MSAWTECPNCKVVLAEPRLYAEPHKAPDGERCVFVLVHKRYFTWDDVVDGDITSDDTDYDVLPCLPDSWDLEDGKTVAHLAAEHIAEASTTEPSTCPGFHAGLWYTHPDGSYDRNWRTGERCEPSSHLYGFTPEEERATWERLTGKASA